MIRLPRDLKAVLDESRVPWSIKTGSRHYKIFLGPRLVGILPFSPNGDHASSHRHRNVVAQVRRAIREYHHAQV